MENKKTFFLGVVLILLFLPLFVQDISAAQTTGNSQLKVSVQADKDIIHEGETVRFTISVTNTGSIAVTPDEFCAAGVYLHGSYSGEILTLNFVEGNPSIGKNLISIENLEPGQTQQGVFKFTMTANHRDAYFTYFALVGANFHTVDKTETYKMLAERPPSAYGYTPKMRITYLNVIPSASKGYNSGDTIMFQVKVKNTGKAAGKLKLDIHADQYGAFGRGRVRLICTPGTSYDCSNPSWGTVTFPECDGAILEPGDSKICVSSSLQIPADAHARRYRAYASSYTCINNKDVKENTLSRYFNVIKNK